MEQLYLQKWEKEGHQFDRALFAEAHEWLQDPQALKTMLVDHLRQMWDEVLQPDWERNLPMLQESVDAYQQL